MRIVRILLIGALLGGCDFQIAGPAYPEKNGGKFLAEHGYSPELIRAVVERMPLEHERVVEFTAIRSTDVRFLVASNPHLTPEEIALYMRDRDDFARSGTAWNRNLSTRQMLALMQDTSHTVYCGLARNPAVPSDLLLKLHAERKPGLVWFALNPQCPVEIKDEIEKSNDDLAKHWLKFNEDKAKGLPAGSRGSVPAARDP